MDWILRVTLMAGSTTLGSYAAAAAAAGLGRPGVATLTLWILTAVAAVGAITCLVTPASLSGQRVAAVAAMADLGIALALTGLRDPRLMLIGCGLFAVLAVFVAIHVPALGLIAHVVFVTAFICNAAGVVLSSTNTSVVVVVLGSTILIWVCVAVPVITRQVWIAVSYTAELASVDPLTGVLNRAGLNRGYRRLAACARSDGTSMVVVAADLDKFKSVNDRYGHPVGDAVIIETAQHLTRHFGHDAAVARCGGEEFSVLIVGDSARLRHLVDSLSTITPGVNGPATTMSVGASWCDYRASDHPLQRAMTTADRAMYVAKAAGGNTSSTPLELNLTD